MKGKTRFTIEKVPMKDSLQIVGTNESFIYEGKQKEIRMKL
ncbi:hypothetical protein [Anaerobutyricum hallii]